MTIGNLEYLLLLEFKRGDRKFPAYLTAKQGQRQQRSTLLGTVVTEISAFSRTAKQGQSLSLSKDAGTPYSN